VVFILRMMIENHILLCFSFWNWVLSYRATCLIPRRLLLHEIITILDITVDHILGLFVRNNPNLFFIFQRVLYFGEYVEQLMD